MKHSGKSGKSGKSRKRACIVTKGMHGSCHRNDGIGAKAPTNFTGGGPSPFIRQTYEVAQPVATDSYPVRGHDQMAMKGVGPLKGAHRAGVK